jgi:serine/threonine protein kinase
VNPAKAGDDLQEALGPAYRLEREIGRGGMARVFLAHDTKHDRLVALKLLNAELAASLGAERFRRETALAARLQHPHIVTVLDSGETRAGQLWFTMPYIEGESLRERLVREPQLAVHGALRITREVANALEYAHGHGVVHRDVKPANIFLSGEHALLMDFGIARPMQVAAGLPDETDSLTATGLIVGTPAYVSPEQASADPSLDGRTDIYSLATVLYEMLAGELPFTGRTAQALIAKRLSTRRHQSVSSVRVSPAPSTSRCARRLLRRQQTGIGRRRRSHARSCWTNAIL